MIAGACLLFIRLVDCLFVDSGCVLLVVICCDFAYILCLPLTIR